MSLFGFKKASGHTTAQEQGYGVITSSTYHDTKSYVAKTEKVVAHGNFPAMIGTEYGSPRKDTHGISTFDQEHEKNGSFPPKSHDVMARGNTKNSPWNNGGTNNSPPYYTTNDYGSRPDYRKDENYYENEKSKKNGYTPPTYSVPISNQPKKETRFEPYNSGYNDKDKATDYGSRATTFATRAKNGTNYETSNNKSISTSPPERNAWPKNNREKQETIDSTEARRRYGDGNHEVGNYNTYGTINCIDAAEKYGGKLLPN